MKKSSVLGVFLKVAKWLGQSAGVTLTTGGTGAWTDGKHINLPAMPELVDEATLIKMRGYLDHESAHCVFTDFTVDRAGAMVATFSNIFEDVRIEALQSEKYPGCRANLAALTDMVCREGGFGFNLQQPISVIQSALLSEGRATVLGQATRQQADESWNGVAALFPTLLDPLKAIASRIGGLQSTADAVALAKETVLLLKQEAEKQPQQEEQQQEEEQQNQQDQNDQDGSDSDSTSDDDSDDSDKPGSKGRGKEGQESEESKEEDGDDSGSKGDDTDNSKDEGSSSNGDNTKGSEAKNSDNDGSKEEGGDSSKGADAENSEENGDGSGSDSDSEGAEGDGAEGSSEGGQGDQKPGQDSGKGNGSRSNSDSNSVGKGGQGAGGGAPTAEEIAAIREVLAEAASGLHEDFGDVAKAAAEALHAVAEEAERQGTVGKVVIPPTCPSAAPGYAIDATLARRATTGLRGGLRTALQSRKFAPEVTGVSGTRLNTRVLHRVPAGDCRVFKRREERVEVNTAVVFLGDTSGSTNNLAGGKRVATLVGEAMYAAVNALQGVPNTATCAGHYPVRGDHGVGVGLVLPFGGRAKENAFNFYPSGGTPTDLALYWAGWQLANRQEQRKLVILCTDGEPNSQDETIAARKALEAAGIEVIGIGVGNDARKIKATIPRSVHIGSVLDLPSTLIGVLKEGMMKGGRQ